MESDYNKSGVFNYTKEAEVMQRVEDYDQHDVR